jgi:hypothetical protein
VDAAVAPLASPTPDPEELPAGWDVLEQLLAEAEYAQEDLRARYGGGMGTMPFAVQWAYEARDLYVRTLRAYCRGV